MKSLAKAKSILLIHVSGRVGDSLLATPAILAVINKHPNAKIDLLVHRNQMSLFENIPGIASLNSISDKRAFWKGRVSFFSKYNFSVVFNYLEPLKEITRYSLRVSEKVIAYESKDKELNKKLFIKLKRNLDNNHFTDYYLTLTNAIGAFPNNKRIRFFLNPREMAIAENILSPIIKDKKLFLVGIQLSCFPTHSYRNWPLQNFIELSKVIKEKYPNTFFIIFGSKDDKKIANDFIKDLGKNTSLNLSGLSLRLTGAVMKNINLYIGLDTGPSQLMSSFDVPFVSIYHYSNPSKKSKPLDHPYSVIIDSKSKVNEAYISDISVNFVYKKIKCILTNE
jgi:heptosyltransferase-3